MQDWNITEGGASGQPTYRLLTGQARHTRQSELARCPGVPLLARQRDLNHTDPGMQQYYQHVLKQENEELMSAVMKSPLRGHDAEWLQGLLRLSGTEESDGDSPYREGLVRLSTPRWRKLVENNGLYFEPNAVEKGTCDAPQGPAGCDHYRPDVAATKEREENNELKASGECKNNPSESSRNLPATDSAESPLSAGSGGVESSDSASLVRRLRIRARQIEEEEL